ncbi:hypothetical protein [Duncaniella freteri]|uniref:hypothetical protein n=1 Tax=Duncaniella freteri TaxID=2530391 RepID=UPI002573FDD1|nr:hypothetical protein [Duncaniella freteri]
MRQMLYRLMLLSVVMCVMPSLVSCSDDDNGVSTLPQIFIEKSHFTMAKGDVTILVTAEVPPVQDIRIPVRLGGSAVRDVDYTISDEGVVIKAGETTGSFIVSRIEESMPDDKLELFINLAEAPSGYSLGLVNYASINLLGKNGYVMSFMETAGTIDLDGEFKLKLYDMKGSMYRPKVEEIFEVEIDAEQSTAVEGEHFEMPEGHVIKYPANAREGILKVNMLKVEPGRDKIVFRLVDKDGYAVGANPEMTVTIKGPDNFSGTWQFDHFDFADVQMYEDWGMANIYPDKAPVASADDKMVLTGETYEKYAFTPQFGKDLTKYFGSGTRDVEFIKVDKEFKDQNGVNTNFTRLKVPGINISFSDTKQDIRDAQVAFNLIQSDGKEYLECWIGDWIPVYGEYGGDLSDWIYDDTYLWTMAPIRIYFTRVQ